MKKGISNLLLVLFFGILAGFVLLIIQTRLNQAIFRQQGTADALIATYDSESKIFDILTRIINYHQDVSSITVPAELADKTKLKLTQTNDGTTKIISLEADRPYSVTKTNVDINSGGTTTSLIDEIDIALILDCTSSMLYPADNWVEGQPIPDMTLTTRLYELRNAMVGDVTDGALQPLSKRSDANKFKVGIYTFGIEAKQYFPFTTMDKAANPNGMIDTIKKDIDISKIKYSKSSWIDNDIRNAFFQDSTKVPFCAGVRNATSIGSGLEAANSYFNNPANFDPTKKYAKIEILVTDGEPNTRIPSTTCLSLNPANSYCPNDPGWCGANPPGWFCPSPLDKAVCKDEALNFMKCSLTPGKRPLDVQDFVVTVYANVPTNVTTILNDPNYVTKYYPLANATELKSLLDSIITEIITNNTTIKIKREVD